MDAKHEGPEKSHLRAGWDEKGGERQTGEKVDEVHPSLDRVVLDIGLALRRLRECSTHLHPVGFQFIELSLIQALSILEEFQDGNPNP